MANILVVPDKFKGTLSAAEAAAAITEGWRQIRPEDQLRSLPMSDGGDGFGQIVSNLIGALPQSTKTVDAAHRPLEAVWWWHPAEKTAIIESARVVGLAQLPPGKYHPFELDTEGLGVLLQTASAQGARKCIVGVGGSATNDGGFGMATALGWQFFNDRREKIVRWTELHTLSQIRPPDTALQFEDFSVAVDVRNPLLGPEGCTRIYGPQKGLGSQDFAFAEKCLGRMAEILEKELHLEVQNKPGAGAAGGLGFGLCGFAGARLEDGFELFTRYADLGRQLPELDLVITGEGSIDQSTLMGKGVGQLAQLCRKAGVPCIALAGRGPAATETQDLFSLLATITPTLADPQAAMSEPARWLQQLAQQTARQWSDQRR